MSRIYNRKSHSKALFQKKRSIRFLVFIVVFVLVAMLAVGIFDDRQLRVEQLTVTLPSLPRAFEGYTLALLSDLNGRRFGEEQSTLISMLSSYKYDAILLTGDMAGSNGDAAAFFELLDALGSERTVFFVPGELDPPMYEMKNGVYAPSEFYEGLIARGVVYLELPEAITRGDSTIWMSPASRLGQDTDAILQSIDLRIAELETDPALSDDERVLELARARQRRDIYTRLSDINGQMQPEHAQLAVSHYPLTDAIMDTIRNNAQQRSNVDIVFSGHYIRGGSRVPLFGALYVDAPAMPRKGWFPNQKSISGLTDTGGAMQYISPGLGARGWPGLRLFNAPTIPIVRLSSTWHQ